MENTDEFKVEVAVPGFDKGDFKIELNHDVLTISSEKQIENESKEDEHFSKREFSYQSFTRSFTLPHTADSERIDAVTTKVFCTSTFLKEKSRSQNFTDDRNQINNSVHPEL